MFDNDGTLWCEKPMPIQLDFIIRRLAEMAQAHPELRERQPWKAVADARLAWFGSLMAEHYAGDDTNVRMLARRNPGRLRRDQRGGLRDAVGHLHPHGRPSHPRPRLPGMRLRADGGTARATWTPTDSPRYIVSGGGRDFMRPISQDMYGIPRDRVIGSSSTFAYTSNDNGGTITHKPEVDYLDDGPEKPVRIWNRTGRRPLLAAGNSNGDVPMLEFTHHTDKPTLRLLLLHDDAEREFDYTTGAEQALSRAKADRWTVTSIKNDWTTVF